MNNYEESSASSELSNMGRKTIGVAQNVGNLALGMGRGFKAGLKSKDDKDKPKPAEKVDGLPKKSSIDDSSNDIKDIGKKAAKTGGKIAKEGAKVVGNGLKKLWMLIPPPWNFIVLGFLLVLILILFLILALGGSSDSCEYETAVPYEYNCPTINVVGVGDVPFEEYVAGVVGGEVGVLKNPELYKALAVGARTYALNYTNKCTKSIPNDTTAQVYNPSYINDAILEAVEATEDEVLIYNGSLISTMYDSFNVSRGSCSGSTCSTTYTKLPNGEKHTVTISSPYYNYVNGGHGSGLSQVAAYEMAENGSTYEEILEFFYSDGVQIANHTSENCDDKDYDGDMLEYAMELDFDGDYWNYWIKNTTRLEGSSLQSVLGNDGLNDLNNYLNTLAESGDDWGTKVAQVGMGLAKYLFDEGYRLPYYWGGGHGTISIGANPYWGGSAGAMCSSARCYYYNGLDCSGFVRWAIKNAGCSYSDGFLGFKSFMAKTPRRSSLKDLQPGDLLMSSGHVILVVAYREDLNRVVTVESAGGTNGLIVRAYADGGLGGYYKLDMDNYYKKC